MSPYDRRDTVALGIAALAGLAWGSASWLMTEGQPHLLLFVLPPYAYTIGLVAMSITRRYRLDVGLAGVIATNLPTAFYVSPALEQEGGSAAVVFGVFTTLLPMALLWLLHHKAHKQP
jgi:hypothetical protein